MTFLCLPFDYTLTISRSWGESLNGGRNNYFTLSLSDAGKHIQLTGLRLLFRNDKIVLCNDGLFCIQQVTDGRLLLRVGHELLNEA